MNTMNSSTMGFKKSNDIENIDIDYLISDVLIIKAESVKDKDKKIFNHANCLEKQLLKIKNKQAILEL